MHRNRLKELWVNRPTVFIPKLLKKMKENPYKKGAAESNYFEYIRNMKYLVWEVVFEGGEKK